MTPQARELSVVRLRDTYAEGQDYLDHAVEHFGAIEDSIFQITCSAQALKLPAEDAATLQNAVDAIDAALDRIWQVLGCEISRRTPNGSN